MAPIQTRTSRNRRFRPCLSPNPASPAVPNVSRSGIISASLSTNNQPGTSELIDEGNIWNDIPVDYIESEEDQAIQHWRDGSAGIWRATPVYPETPDMFESMLPKLQLDAVWTQEHESRLQQEWEGHPLREALLCARSHRFAGNLLQQPAVALEECALWENTSFYFGCLPSDIISAQHRMMVIPDKVHNYPRIMPKVEGHGSNVQSILWGLKFCRNLNDILLHPIWEGRPILLREAIKYTVVCASGDDERYQTPAMMAAKVYGTNPFQHSDPVQLLYKAIELVAKNEVHKVRKEKKQKVCGRASKTGKDIVYLVRASDITLLTAALQWTDFWSGESGTILSSAWKGIARQLEKPWRVLTEKHQDRGLEQLYLDVLRHQRRWALEV